MADYQSNFLNALQGGYNFGQQIKQQRDENQLKGLAALAYGTPKDQRQPVLQQMAGISPQFAEQQKKSWNADDEADREELVRMAQFIRKAPPEQQAAAYSQILPKLRERGMQAPDWTPETQDVILKTVNALASSYGDATATNPYAGLPSDIQSLKLLQSDPTLAALDKERRQYSSMVPKLVETSQGYGWGTPGGGINLAPLEGVAGGGQQMPVQAPQLFAALGQKYGIQPTSVTRTPERNRQVGGVANSYHLAGQAADFVVPQQLKAQFIQDARQNGYEAIDEGDHIHIEPAGRGGGGGGAPNIAQPFQKPEAPPAGFRRTADGNLEFIPGGPADPFVKNEVTGAQRAKLAATKQKEQQLLRANEAGIDQTITLIDSILSRKGDFGGVTGMGAMGARIPGTKWADLAAALDTLRGRSAFGALQQMRANSPTGGALGSVTERELGLLQNSETQLQNTQSPEALANGLEAYKRVLQETKRRMREGLDEFYQDSGSSPSGSQSGWSIQRVD